MPIDGERFPRRSPFLFIGLFHHDAHHAPWFFLFYNIKNEPPHSGMAVRRLSEEVGNCLVLGQITGIELVILALFGDQLIVAAALDDAALL